MQTFVIARETGDREDDVEFWGCINGINQWTGNHPDATVWFHKVVAETVAEGLRITCCIVQDYGTATQEIVESYYEELEEVGERRQEACANVVEAKKEDEEAAVNDINKAKEVSKELKAMKAFAERQTESRRQAETGEDETLGIHQCELCYTRGVGENDLNLICNPCQNDLRYLLKGDGVELEPLRELFQCYQESKREQCSDRRYRVVA